MIRNQKIKGTFICGPLLFKWMDVFQSWLDCFSIGVQAFIQNINFLSSLVFVYWCPFVAIFKCCNLQSHNIFFQCIKLHQMLSQFSTRNLAQALDNNIFERDYSNLNNPIPSKDINSLHIQSLLQRIGTTSDAEKKKDSFGTTFLKKYSTQDFFFLFSAKRVLCPQVYIFNKVQEPDEVVTQN